MDKTNIHTLTPTYPQMLRDLSESLLRQGRREEAMMCHSLSIVCENNKIDSIHIGRAYMMIKKWRFIKVHNYF